MNKIFFFFIFFVVTLFQTHIVFASEATRYITDIFYVPVRSGPGNNFRIIHQGLKTGTPITLITSNTNSNFSEILLQNGEQGYIRTQYLTATLPARENLIALQTKYNNVLQEKQQIEVQFKNTQKTLNKLSTQNKTALETVSIQKTEINQIKAANKNTLTINARNKQLTKINNELTMQKKKLTEQNTSLIKKSGLIWFALGAGTIMLGILLGLVLPRLKLRKKSFSNWD